jgi:16S rRNA processing protein RimM
MAGPRKKSSARPDEVSLGWIVGVFGTSGEVRLHMHNRESDLLREGRSLVLVDAEGQRSQAHIRSRSGAGGRVLGTIDGVADREGARAAMGREMILAKVDLPETEADVYYHYQLVGLSVRLEGGDVVGVLTEVQDAGPVDLWIVQGEEGEYFVPALATLIVQVDLTAGEVVVTEDGWKSSS